MSVLVERNTFVNNIEMYGRVYLAKQHCFAPATAHAIQCIEEFKGTDAGALFFLEKQGRTIGGQYLSAIQWGETAGHGRHEK